MNKLIYAIGIAVASTFASNTKVEHHQTKNETETVEQTTRTNAVEEPDTLKVDAIKLP